MRFATESRPPPQRQCLHLSSSNGSQLKRLELVDRMSARQRRASFGWGSPSPRHTPRKRPMSLDGIAWTRSPTLQASPTARHSRSQSLNSHQSLGSPRGTSLRYRRPLREDDVHLGGRQRSAAIAQSPRRIYAVSGSPRPSLASVAEERLFAPQGPAAVFSSARSNLSEPLSPTGRPSAIVKRRSPWLVCLLLRRTQVVPFLKSTVRMGTNLASLLCLMASSSAALYVLVARLPRAMRHLALAL